MPALTDAPTVETPPSPAISAPPPWPVPTSDKHEPQGEPAETRIILENVSWGLYEHLLAEHPDRPSPRFAYCDGFLEIMTTGITHENINRTLASLVEQIAGEWDLDFMRAGSITCLREDLEKGFEPDTCFYLGQTVTAVRGKDKLVFPEDPPPDFTIEIDITNSSLPRQPIFAALGIAEAWRYDGRSVRVLRLEEGRYVEVPTSVALSPLDGATIHRFLEESWTMRGPAWLRHVRAWAQAQIASGARHLPTT